MFFAYQDGPEAARALLVTERKQEEVTARAAERFFQPWAQAQPGHSREEAFWGYYWLKPENGFMENLRPYTQERWESLAANADPEGYPSRALPAITVDWADLRLMPTNTPYFFSPARPGQGYPFDYYQNSSLPLGTPVLITHVSRDGAWALIESPSAGGWVQIDKLALVDLDFMIAWKSLPMGAVLTENLPLRPLIDQGRMPVWARVTLNSAGEAAQNDNVGNFDSPSVMEAGAESVGPDNSEPGQPHFENWLPAAPRFVSIGTVLPMQPHPRDFGQVPAGMVPVYYPVKKADGYAQMERAFVPHAGIAAWPLPLTRENMGELIAQMMGQPYGWGGYGGNRDCSSTLRDLYLAFGAWLPRNSRAQAGIGEGIDLEELSPARKEEVILEEGVPFLSLVGLPGHIMLYLGEYDGRAAIFHNVWGLRILQRGTDEHGRAIIGKAVITSLTPGKERKDIARPNSILDTVNKLSFPLERMTNKP